MSTRISNIGIQAAILFSCIFFGCGKEKSSPPEKAMPTRKADNLVDSQIEVPNRVTKLISELDENPDVLHGDYTPAVRKLIDIGQPAIVPILDVMVTDDNQLSRLRAQRVLEGVTMQMHGFEFGQGWRSSDDENNWLKFWASLGNLDWKSTLAERLLAVEAWKSHDWKEETGGRTRGSGIKGQGSGIKGQGQE